MLETYEQKSRVKLITILVTVLVIAGVVVLADHLKNKPTTARSNQLTNSTSNTSTLAPATTATTTTTNATPASTTTNTATTNTSGYTDGSYSTSEDYNVPGNRESITVNLTLSDGVVTAASIRNSETDFTSASYQEQFAAEYKSQVIGKKISGLQINTTAGASDTTQAFNEALSQIMQKAQS